MAKQTKPSKVNKYRIERLYQRAKSGDSTALSELQRLNTLAVNRVNRRLKNIHRVVKSSPAETRMRNLLEDKGIDRLSKSKKLSPEQLRDQLNILNRFENWKTSTIKGYLQYEEEEIARLNKRGIDIDQETFRDQWSDFLQTEAFKEMHDYDSKRALLEGYEALKSGHTLEELNKAWEEYQNQNGYFSEVWEKFTGNPFA